MSTYPDAVMRPEWTVPMLEAALRLIAGLASIRVNNGMKHYLFNITQFWESERLLLYIHFWSIRCRTFTSATFVTASLLLVLLFCCCCCRVICHSLTRMRSELMFVTLFCGSGLCERESCILEVCTLLAMSDRTHSQIKEAMPVKGAHDTTFESHLENILDTVSLCSVAVWQCFCVISSCKTIYQVFLSFYINRCLKV